MAILFSQADGSDQHYDTYEEFERAFVLIKRLNGEKVPQDLLDEVKAKKSRSEPVHFEINGQVFEDLISSAAEPLGRDANGEDLYEGDYVTGSDGNEYRNTNGKVVMEVLGAGKSSLFEEANISVRIVGNSTSYPVDSTKFIKLSDNLDEAKAKFDDKEPKPFQVQIDGTKFETAISEATRELAEALDEAAKDRTPVSDECENTETEPKFEVGDKVRVVSAEDGTDTGYHGFRIGSTVEVKEVYGNGKVDAYDGIFYQTLLPHHFEKVEDSPTEFRTGDIVKVTETFEDIHGDVAASGSVCVYEEWGDSFIFVGTVLLGDNHDKLRLVCRKEVRKDIEL